MKILVIDDQKLIVLAVKKRLTAFGYIVQTANSVEEGVYKYNSFQPDLVVLDMNMPEMSGTELVACTGTEVVKYIRTFMKRDTPILVMSGNTNQSIIAQNYNLGINKYLEKPISLNELADRIKEILGDLEYQLNQKQIIREKQIIKKRAIGIVVYCNNSENAILRNELQTFAIRNLGYQLCFVNDASTDNTLRELRRLRDRNSASITVLNYKQKVDRSEAIRKGVQHLLRSEQLEYVGFLDADDSYDLKHFDTLVKNIETSSHDLISKISVNAESLKSSIAKMTSRIVDLGVSNFYKIPFEVIHGSVKIMKSDTAAYVFKKKFKYHRFFNMQLFGRLKSQAKLRNEELFESNSQLSTTRISI